MLNNLLQLSVALLLLLALTLPIGLLILRLLDLPYRRWHMLPIAALIGMFILPLILNIIGLVTGIALSLTARMILWGLLNIALFYAASRHPQAADLPEDTPQRWLLSIALCASILLILPLLITGVQRGDQVQVTAATDWAKHVAVVSSLTLSDDLPPPTIFLSVEPKLRYYYLPYILPAMIHDLLGGFASPMICMIAAAALTFFALPYGVYSYGRGVGLDAGGAGFAALCSTLIGGFDSVLTVLAILITGILPGDVDFWLKHFDRPIVTPMSNFIWVPQHMQGFLLLMLIFWLIQRLERGSQRPFILGMIAVLMATLAASSGFIWLGGGIILAIFCGVESLRQNWRIALPMIVALSVSLVLSAPHLWLLSQRAAGVPFYFEVSAAGSLAPFNAILGENIIANLLDFPLQMLMEFGALLILGLAGLRLIGRQWRTRLEVRLWLVILISTTFMLLAVRDRPISNNYSVRMGMVIFFLLALGSGFWWMRQTHLKPLMAGLLWIGLLTSIYDPVLWTLHPKTISMEEYSLYEWLAENTTADDVYQIGTGINENYHFYFVRAWTGLSDDAYDIAQIYTAGEDVYARGLALITTGYQSRDAVTSAAALHEARITLVIASPEEPLAATRDPQFSACFESVYETAVYQVYRVKECGD